MTKIKTTNAEQTVFDQWNKFMDGITKPTGRTVAGAPSYICPICGYGKKRGELGLYFDPNKVQLCCNGCNYHGDIIELYMQMYRGTDRRMMLADLAGQLSMYFDDDNVAPVSGKPADGVTANKGATEQAQVSTPVPAPEGRFAEYITKCIANRDNPACIAYLRAHGINDATAVQCRIGYDPDRRMVIVPHGLRGDYYTALPVDGGSAVYPETPPARKNGDIYNLLALYGDQPCFICQDVLSAISVIQAGGSALAIGGTDISALIDLIKENNPLKPPVLSLNHDPKDVYRRDPGQEAQGELAKMLRAAQIRFTEAIYLYDRYGGLLRSPNDLMLADADLFAEDVRYNKCKARSKDNAGYMGIGIGDYLASGDYDVDKEYFAKYRNRKTGFENLDQYLTLYPGLMALGGASSVGKTTFAVNLGINLVRQGETVLYYAMEQERVELATKIFARELLKEDPNTYIDNIGIKNGATNNALDTILTRGKTANRDMLNRFRIFRYDFSLTVNKIRDDVEGFVRATGIRPVVIIDYLQLIAPPTHLRADNERLAINYNIDTLKDLQRDNELLVIMISAFNRSSINTPVSYENFTGTSRIEFECDYVLGLSLALTEKDEYYQYTDEKGEIKETTAKQKTNLARAAISKSTKKDIVLVCLKNRNGRQTFECYYKYDMRYDTFTPVDDPTGRNGDIQFHQVTENQEMPEDWNDETGKKGKQGTYRTARDLVKVR